MNTATVHTETKPPLELTEDTLRLIDRRARAKARWMIEKAGFPESGHDDYVQDLTTGVLKALPTYDPTRGPLEAFVARVTRNSAIQMARQRGAQAGTDPLVVANTPLVEEVDRSLHARGTSGEREQLPIDLADFLATLPPPLRELCERLKTQSWGSALSDMGIPNGQKSHLQQELRTHFTAAGFSLADIWD